MIGPAHLGQFLKGQARIRPESIGVRDLSREMSFALWNERACRLGNALAGLGLRKGERVAILAYNRIEWAEIYLATAKSGLVAVPLNFRLTGSEIAFIISDVGASALLVENVLSGTIADIRDQISIEDDRIVSFGSGNSQLKSLGYEDLIAVASRDEPDAPVLPDDPWCIMYTSGTTGRPKGAIRDHGSTARLALMTGVELSISRGDDALLVMPMCHANSVYFFASYLYCGAAISIFSRPSFDPELCLRALADQGNTFTSLVPTHYSMLLEVPDNTYDASRLERMSKLMISSAPARAPVKRAVMEMFPRSGLFELYGSTEAGWVTMLHPHEQFDKLGSVGREVAGSDAIRLLDEDGQEVRDGEPGELFSAGPCNFAGYWELPEKTKEAFRGNHLSVGDMAVRDEDGFIWLVDRKNNLIISGGENIYPSEVENVLAAHPEVSDVAVIGKSDAKWGETVHAVVILNAQSSISADSLLEWASPQLAGYKRPRHITFIAPNEMPRNATGKILHRVLREQVCEPIQS